MVYFFLIPFIKGIMKTNIDIKKNLGGRIRTLRKLKGWTQEQLGEKAIVDYKFISEIERGNKNPSFEILYKIAGAFEIELSELLKFQAEQTDRLGLEKELIELIKNIPNNELVKLVGVLRVFYPFNF